MYKKIRSHPGVYKIYGNKLVNEQSITEELLNQNVKSFKELLDEQYKSAKDYKPKIEWFEGTWSRYKPEKGKDKSCLLYTSPSPRDRQKARMPSSA